MANYYFYTDANGNKQGPYSTQALQNLATDGKITPTTPLETEDKRSVGLAGQFSGLKFKVGTHMWQFNFASHLWTCKVCCILVWIVAILTGLIVTGWGYQIIASGYAPDSAKFFAFIAIVGTWGYCAFCIAATHLLCTWSLITSKAAQLYVENCEKK